MARSMPASRIVKIAVFAVLLAAAGAFLGLVLRWGGDAHEYIMPPSWGALWLALWFVGAVAAVALTAGIVAVLVRPFWAAAIAFALSALALFLAWEISLLSLVAAVIYFAAGLLYFAAVSKEIKERIRFSALRLFGVQILLIVALAALACTSAYFGYAEEVDAQGVTVPPQTVEWVLEKADSYLDPLVPAGFKRDALQEIREFMEEGVPQKAEQYEGYTKAGYAATIFFVLAPVTIYVCWIPLLVLALVLWLLVRCGVVHRVTEMVEVTRLRL